MTGLSHDLVKYNLAYYSIATYILFAPTFLLWWILIFFRCVYIWGPMTVISFCSFLSLTNNNLRKYWTYELAAKYGKIGSIVSQFWRIPWFLLNHMNLRHLHPEAAAFGSCCKRSEQNFYSTYENSENNITFSKAYSLRSIRAYFRFRLKQLIL